MHDHVGVALIRARPCSINDVWPLIVHDKLDNVETKLRSCSNLCGIEVYTCLNKARDLQSLLWFQIQAIWLLI